MRNIAALFIAPFLALFAMMAAPVSAQIISVESWVEEFDPVTQQWVRVDDGAQRFVSAHSDLRAPAIAYYGPFQVIDGHRAALMGVTDAGSPGDFAAMLRAYPQLATLELIEAPGTANDRANMRLGRMIRAAGLTTRVPAGGSVRSGGVELFLAGASREIADGAEFAVHSWRDEYGRQPSDFAADDPVNLSYLDYYAEMGFAPEQARAFYDLTNSVPHEQALWLTAGDMRGWLAPVEGAVQAGPAVKDSPRLAYSGLALALDSGTSFN